MDALAKCEVRIRRASEIQQLRLCELDFVMICRSDHAQHQRSGWDSPATRIHRLQCVALRRELDRAGVAEQLFDGSPVCQQRGLRAQTLELLGVLQQGERPVTNEIDGSLVDGYQKKQEYGDEIIRVMAIARHLRLRTRGQ